MKCKNHDRNKVDVWWVALWKSSRKLDTASKGQEKQNCESESKKMKENDASKESNINVVRNIENLQTTNKNIYLQQNLSVFYNFGVTLTRDVKK